MKSTGNTEATSSARGVLATIKIGIFIWYTRREFFFCHRYSQKTLQAKSIMWMEAQGYASVLFLNEKFSNFWDKLQDVSEPELPVHASIARYDENAATTYFGCITSFTLKSWTHLQEVAVLNIQFLCQSGKCLDECCNWRASSRSPAKRSFRPLQRRSA